MSVSRNKHFQSFTVGKLDAGMILIGERAHLIEFPSLLLPPGTVSGSIVSISVLRDHSAERSHAKAFSTLQSDILEAYGTTSPVAPVLSLLNTTQTSVTLEWGKLDVASATLRSVEIYRNGSRLAGIPNPSHNTSTKLSSLQLDTDYTFQLVMKTSAGTYPSNVIRVRTHTMNDTSGISVCFGNIQDPNLLHQAQRALDQMGARYSDKIQIDTTHFVCTTPAGPTGSGPSVEYQRALQLTLPVVEPGWIFACLQEKKMVPISQHLLGSNTTYNPINNASFTRLAQAPAGGQVSPRTVSDGVDIQRQPSPETRARSSIPDEVGPGSVAPDDDVRPVFERPPSVTGGKLNRGFKFPLSTENLALQKTDEEASRQPVVVAPAPTPVIAEAAIIHDSDTEGAGEEAAAPDAGHSEADDTEDDDAKTPTALPKEFESVDLDGPEQVVVSGPSEGAFEPPSPPSIVVDAPEDRPRPSIPELVFSPPPEEMETPSFPVSPAAELEATEPAEEEHEVEPTAVEAAVEEQLAEELVHESTPTEMVAPAEEIEATTAAEEIVETETTREEAVDEVKQAEELTEGTMDNAPEEEEAEDTPTEGVASADATDDDGTAADEQAGEEGSADGAGEKPKAKKNKKKKKTKSIAK